MGWFVVWVAISLFYKTDDNWWIENVSSGSSPFAEPDRPPNFIVLENLSVLLAKKLNLFSTNGNHRITEECSMFRCDALRCLTFIQTIYLW